MATHASPNGPSSSSSTHLDILIIGAGLSGINAAYRIQESLPASSLAILEARHELGGTWSQFTYPGVRSDSDLHTLGFQFNPWTLPNAIASGESIMLYLRETARKFDIEGKIRYRHRVRAVDWREGEQKWRVEVDVGGNSNGEGEGVTKTVYWANWLIMGTGYYSYEEPLKAIIPGLENFQGRTVHPQFWPKDMDYKGKKIVVVGSGATAITLLPALVDEGAESVTQLQRSPSYVLSQPQEDESWWERFVPKWVVLKYKRYMHILVATLFYKFCIAFPVRAASFLRGEAKRQLPPDFALDPSFKPNYNPWEQRLCLCPDGDYFKCFASGRAHVVTDTIQNVVPDGIELSSGEKLEADIIVTATGLKMQILGNIAVSVDGVRIDIPSQYLWRFSMLTSLPNFGNIIGYCSASWTLGSDTASRLFVRLISHMKDNGYTSVTPTISEEDAKESVLASPLKSTYVKSSLSALPKCGTRGPWRPRDHYFVDRWRAGMGSLEDGLVWRKVST